MPCGTDDLVGASLLAKTVFQLMHFRRLCSPFREQARSHRYGVFSSHVKNSTGPGCVQAMWITHTGRLCFEPCECPAALMTWWERACSRRRCFTRCIFGASTDPFASKLAPTGQWCFSSHVKHSHRSGLSSSHVDYSHRSAVFRAMRMPCGNDDLVGASLLAKTVFHSMHFRRFYRPFREQARSHRSGVFSSHVDYSHRSAMSDGAESARFRADRSASQMSLRPSSNA